MKPDIGMAKGNLAVVSVTRVGRGWLCLCKCSCGQVVFMQASRITGYRSRFASCNINGHRYNGTRVHGHTKRGNNSPTFNCWNSMIQRCHNPLNSSYDRYGGRGVVVCDRWKLFINFLRDMGIRPDGLTLGRINNDGNYEPSNCRWETRSQQARNRRSSHFIEHNGQRKTIAEWSEITGLSQKAIQQRASAGWASDKILTTPAMKNQYTYAN